MPGTVPDSSILEFFNEAKVFITGGTGFLGKALIEKLLRVFQNIDHIYILIRPKKGKDPLARMKELFDDPLFNTLRKEKPDFEKKVTCIFGDIGSLRLNMSDSDYSFLTGEVTHVIHSAATVRFNEKLKTALEINVLGVREISIFCNKCARLKVFVHVSTAYAHCVRSVIGEDFYDPPLSGDEALGLLNIFNEEKLNSMTPELVKPWPNTYSYTKSISENVVREYCKSIPTVIFRPGIVMGTMKEPVPGWIDNIYGPTGVIVAVGVGLMRAMYADESIIANIIPVDMTVNAILSCAWEAGSNFNNSAQENSVSDSKESGRTIGPGPQIYNFVVDESNSLTWGEFLKVNLNYGLQWQKCDIGSKFDPIIQEVFGIVLSPSSKAVWYYTLTITKVKFFYLSLIILLHHIPAIISDAALALMGRKPQMIKAYRKIHSFSDVMVVFAINSWKFTNPNLKKLWSRLSDTDKELFYFDMTNVNWNDYFLNVIMGVRQYIFNESDHLLPVARKKMFFFWLGHRLIQFCFVAFSLWILAKCFFTFDSPKSQFKEQIPMSLDLLINSTN